MTRTATIIGGGVIGVGSAARSLLDGWNVQVVGLDPRGRPTLDDRAAQGK